MATNQGPGGRLWDAIRKGPERAADAAQMVTDLYGVTPRGKPDTRAAAQDLGVSQRTVQRWLQRGLLPSRSRSGGAERLASGHQGWRQSPAGRRAALSPRREARLRNKGTTIRYLGVITISADRRRRSAVVPLDGERMGRILNQILAGNDAAAHRELEDAFGDRFGGSVTLSDIDSLDTFK